MQKDTIELYGEKNFCYSINQRDNENISTNRTVFSELLCLDSEEQFDEYNNNVCFKCRLSWACLTIILLFTEKSIGFVHFLPFKQPSWCIFVHLYHNIVIEILFLQKSIFFYDRRSRPFLQNNFAFYVNYHWAHYVNHKNIPRLKVLER